MPENDLSIIVAMSENRVIGRHGDLPWRLRDDLRRFKTLTMGHPIIMGRRTFDSIGGPLPGRENIVVTRQSTFHAPESARIAHTVDDAILEARARRDVDVREIFLIGGGELYKQTIDRVGRLYVTLVHATIRDGDTFFPVIDPDRWTIEREEAHDADARNDFAHTFRVLVREPEPCNRPA